MFTFALATGQTEHCNCPQGLQKTSAAARNDGAIAQLVEQRTENPCVAGSIPAGTTSKTAACSNAGGCLVFDGYTIPAQIRAICLSQTPCFRIVFSVKRIYHFRPDHPALDLYYAADDIHFMPPNKDATLYPMSVTTYFRSYVHNVLETKFDCMGI